MIKDRKNPDIVLLEGMPDEKISIKTDPLQTEITSKDELGTDSCKREGKMIWYKSKSYSERSELYRPGVCE